MKVTVNGHQFDWDPDNGLDPEAVVQLTYFIRRVAIKYLDVGTRYGYDLGDIISLGTLGALTACRSYVPGKSSFITWAFYYIRNAINHGISPDLVGAPNICQQAKKFKAAASAGKELPAFNTHWSSLDAPLKVGTTLGGCLADDSTDPCQRILVHDVFRAMSQLPERQQFVLKCRYMLEMELAEIGKLLGCSRQRVQQIEVAALKRLRKKLKVN